MSFRRCPSALLLVALSALTAAGPAVVRGAEEFIPRKQTKPPNKPFTPAEAIARMTVPEGFSVELVAAEPDIVNPVAMTFDERGRIWITESLEYPRRAPGKGQDRVKVLEDTDGDGTAESVKIFAEGLNIPSGIAVGHGGVWVANAPDILFYPDADRDAVADGPPQVVVTGFGRDDTHELPNSLTWGPDGFLYGLNGVFNPSKVVQNGKTFSFTCAMFRIHPRTREFSLFCEGTSNPWGIAFNENGDAFISACVIDHLWHLTETGYYHRQGGPYPPHTWKLESIVDYKHQMAAYCGITWFDGDAYPEKYRKKLYMGNIHGGCINVDRLERNGATYEGNPEPDFLSANDVWFMPVVQKTGPDGCLYILDWYDRYHCYQDANYDPKGVDRLKGRLYRVRYQETPRAAKFDLAEETDDRLIERLQSPNVFFRDLAQRILSERREPATKAKLEKLVLDSGKKKEHRLRALGTLLAAEQLDEATHLKLFDDQDSIVQAWAARAAGNLRSKSSAVLERVKQCCLSSDVDVQLQALVAAAKCLPPGEAALQLFRVGRRTHQVVIPNIIWQNLLPLLPGQHELLLAEFESSEPDALTFNPHLGRTFNWLLSQNQAEVEKAAVVLAKTPYVQGVRIVADKLRTGELSGEKEAILRKVLEKRLVADLSEALSKPSQGVGDFTIAVLCYWKNPDAIGIARRTVENPLGLNDEEDRAMSLDYWASSRDPALVELLPTMLAKTSGNSTALRRRLLDLMIRYETPEVASQVLEIYPQLEEELKPSAVELLTSRVAWSNALLDAIGGGKVSKDAVNVNQIRKLLKSNDKKLIARVGETWGALRTDRNPQREQVVAKIKELLLKSPAGDPQNGQVVFTRLCGQCHKIHGQGQDVGPDITSNGRASLDQMLSNIFDPSLVIGNAYRARIVSTADGRVLTGLLVEDSPQRIVLKLQGGKLETIARTDVEEAEISNLSLMPEGVETQYKPEEIIDLFAFLKLDKPPSDPNAKVLPNFGDLPSRK
jgi:putative membrane-bound dehydrogenase-like protein